jgi:hypothetical protein
MLISYGRIKGKKKCGKTCFEGGKTGAMAENEVKSGRPGESQGLGKKKHGKYSTRV